MTPSRLDMLNETCVLEDSRLALEQDLLIHKDRQGQPIAIIEIEQILNVDTGLRVSGIAVVFVLLAVGAGYLGYSVIGGGVLAWISYLVGGLLGLLGLIGLVERTLKVKVLDEDITYSISEEKEALKGFVVTLRSAISAIRA